jgi:hypothetical protein
LVGVAAVDVQAVDRPRVELPDLKALVAVAQRQGAVAHVAKPRQRVRARGRPEPLAGVLYPERLGALERRLHADVPQPAHHGAEDQRAHRGARRLLAALQRVLQLELDDRG